MVSSPGNITPLLAKAFPNAEIIGLDSSSAMIEAGRKANTQIGDRVSFILGDMNDYSKEPATGFLF
jgi:trans-aconitate methyltransferase